MDIDTFVQIMYNLATVGILYSVAIIILTIIDFKEYKKHGYHKFFEELQD